MTYYQEMNRLFDLVKFYSPYLVGFDNVMITMLRLNPRKVIDYKYVKRCINYFKFHKYSFDFLLALHDAYMDFKAS